eukprot:TRINITY_DN12002_c0_g1_i1.p1 TRINITY_DN12002_c0_g1~~TRINITY_DN12002_c0_g1_i1.p1  ORF type:complete len:371 (+),score=54.48 TRINITY_DN12002_c0_g1_i1:108-1220(+)
MWSQKPEQRHLLSRSALTIVTVVSVVAVLVFGAITIGVTVGICHAPIGTSSGLSVATSFHAPRAVTSGNTVSLISTSSPWSYRFYDGQMGDLLNYLSNTLGLSTSFGAHYNETLGYLAGPDQDRAADVMTAFKNPNVQFILALRGGYGCLRIIDLLDYDAIRQNNKVFVGYSDLTGCLTAITLQTGMKTFYGPLGLSNMSNLNGFYLKKVVFDGAQMLFQNPAGYPITTIHGGKARGILLGGLLRIFVSLLGSKYLPLDYPWESVVLFLEDTNQLPEYIDRGLMQLRLSGVLGRVAGVVWGTCLGCTPTVPAQSLTLPQIFQDHFGPLQVPVFTGAMIGHIDQQFTLPLGGRIEIDADAGTLQMLEAGVA